MKIRIQTTKEKELSLVDLMNIVYVKKGQEPAKVIDTFVFGALYQSRDDVSHAKAVPAALAALYDIFGARRSWCDGTISEEVAKVINSYDQNLDNLNTRMLGQLVSAALIYPTNSRDQSTMTIQRDVPADMAEGIIAGTLEIFGNAGHSLGHHGKGGEIIVHGNVVSLGNSNNVTYRIDGEIGRIDPEVTSRNQIYQKGKRLN